MGKRTILQQQLEKSRRLLINQDEQKISSTVSSVEPTLGKYIRERNLPPTESPFDGPFQRTTSEAVKQHTGDFGTMVAERITRMREVVESELPMVDVDERGTPISIDTPLWSVQQNEDIIRRDGAIPVWREVLSLHRGYQRPSNDAKTQHATMMGSEPQIAGSNLDPVPLELESDRPSWPPVFTPNQSYSWSKWHIGPSNRLATTAARESITNPAERANPLVLIGGHGVGKSHLLWAIGDSFNTQIPTSEVRILSGKTCPLHLPDDWSESIQGCSALLIDDIHLITGPVERNNLSIMIDWCLNLGVQVIITSEDKNIFSDDWGGIFNSINPVSMSQPDELSLVLYLRNLTLKRGNSLSDEQLRVIASNAKGDWRAATAGFESVSLSIEAGAEPIGISDIEKILSGEELPMRDDDGLISWDSESTGQKIVREVLDNVLPRGQHPNIDLISELETQVDDYQPPDLMPEDSRDAVDSLIQRHLGREKSALDDARERIEMAAAPTEIEAPRGELPSLDLMSNAFLDSLESRISDHQEELFSIHAEMESISHKIEDAEPSELVELADRMLEIERKLSRFSRLGAGEELVSRNKPNRPYEHQSIEEYIPKGDWNIDETDVSASDLLMEQKSILRPIVVLQAESHEEE